MKFSLPLAACAALSVVPAAAFTASLGRISSCRSYGNSIIGMAVRTDADSSDLVKEALAMSEKYGPTSSEARLAWETVEEVNASDNSVASMGNLNDECDVEVVTQECLEYNAQLEDLQDLLEAHAPGMTSFSKELAETIEPIKLVRPEAPGAPPIPELAAALEEARSLTDRHGLDYPESVVAWETVEEIAASGSSNALGGSLDEDECLVEAAREACAALEELQKIISARKKA